MRFQKPLITSILLASILAITTYGLFYILLGAHFSHPNAEDLSLCTEPLHHGVFSSSKEVLQKYDGRYFTNILHGINPLSFGQIQGYKWVTIFTALFTVYSLYFLLSGIWRKKNKFKLILVSALFVVSNYALSSSLNHQLYWMVSSFVYSYSWNFWFLWLGVLFRWKNAQNSRTKTTLFLANHLLIFLATGINEMFLLINLFSLIFLYIYFFKHDKNQLKWFQSVAVTGLASILFFISQPGISIRFNSFDAYRVDNHYISIIIKSLEHNLQEWLRISTSGLVGISISIVILYLFSESFTSIAARFKTKHILLYFMLVLFGLYLSSLAFYIPMGHEQFLPDRIFSSLNIGFQLAYIVFLSTLFAKFLSIKMIESTFAGILSLAFIVVFAAFILFGKNNIHRIKYDYKKGKLEAFSDQMNNRYETIRLAKESNACWKKAVFPKLNNVPNSIFWPPDIEANKESFYWNNAYEKYFQIDEVGLQNDTISDREYLRLIL